MNKNKILGNVLLILTAFIWGTAFAAQRAGMDYVGPFTFMAARYFLALISLGLISIIYKLQNNKKDVNEKTDHTSSKNKKLILGGIVMGSFLFLGSAFQQVGIQYTSVGKAGFITSLYIVLIPLFGIFTHKKIRLVIWFGVLLAVVGLYLLTIKENLSIGYGDLIVLLGSFVWAGHILSIDYFSKKVDPVYISFFQFSFCFLLSVIAMFIVEKPDFQNIIKGWFPIFYAGVISAGIGFTLQIIGQKNTEPTIASLIMSLESVFGALAGYYLLNEVLTVKELIGCVLLFGAIIIAQLPEKKRYEKN